LKVRNNENVSETRKQLTVMNSENILDTQQATLIEVGNTEATQVGGLGLIEEGAKSETPPAITESEVQIAAEAATPTTPVGMWNRPVEIALNKFKHKSLSDWGCNIAVGCSHGCRFCYVPEVSTMKQAKPLALRGVADPDAQWGEYVFLRPFDEKKFIASIQRAEKIPTEELSVDGHRAVMLCTTTDPYMVIKHPDKAEQKKLNDARRTMVTRMLELIRDHSTLKVRILTRSPLVREDFEVLKSLGNRVILGMSIPTLRHDLAKVYEPGAPAPARRLETLKAASTAGIPVAVMMAPTFAECDRADLKATMEAIKELNPVTVFHEPINIRADNAKRIELGAKELGVQINTTVFETKDTWAQYALKSFSDIEAVAREVGLFDRLHLWVDAALGTVDAIQNRHEPDAYKAWVYYWWNRISEWPGEVERPSNTENAPRNPFGEEMKPLEQDDIEFQATREEVVAQGITHSIAAAKGLSEIKDYKDGVLWRREYKNFQCYCLAKWGYQKSQAYRLADSGRFILMLEALNSSDSAKTEKVALPVNENQVRSIMEVPEKQRIEAWKVAVCESPVEKLTGSEIKEKVKDFIPAKAVRAAMVAAQPTLVVVPKPTPMDVLVQLEVTVTGHPKVVEIRPLLDQVKKLIEAA
jgi:DNA repair photolyase